MTHKRIHTFAVAIGFVIFFIAMFALMMSDTSSHAVGVSLPWSGSLTESIQIAVSNRWVQMFAGTVFCGVLYLFKL